MADEAAAMSKAHKVWILALLKDKGGKCIYEDVVVEGEKHHCDTVGAMLKILKNAKVISFKQQFLMYPMHKAEEITLTNAEYVP